MRIVWLVGLAMQLGFVAPAAAVSFTPLENPAYGPFVARRISADGSTLVGYAEQFDPVFGFNRRRGFVWQGAGTPQALPESFEPTSLEVSGDGSTIAGTGWLDRQTPFEPARAYVLRDGEYQELPIPTPEVMLIEGISNDGDTIVTSLGRIDGSVRTPLSFAPADISGDGRVVIGRTTGTDPELIRSIDGGPGLPIELPSDAMPGGLAHVASVSFDGSVITGDYTNASDERTGFRWEDGTATPLAVGSTSYVRVSGDGSVMIGFDTIWLGLQRSLLEEFLTDLGLDVADWSSLRAFDVSDDGRTIIGIGTDPSGAPRSWIAVIPEPGTGVMLALGLATLGARARRTTRRRHDGA